jgi:hypothetical protein
MFEDIQIPDLYFYGRKVDTSPEVFGELRSSIDAVDDPIELHRRQEADGYIFLPGYLYTDLVLEAREHILQKLDQKGYLNPNYPASMGIGREGIEIRSTLPELARDNAPLTRLLFSGRMIEFYRSFLGGPVRAFDYTWCRVKTRGDNTAANPHYDIVFMGRGTKQLYTSWTPLGDVPLHMGGLIVLEHSHRLEHLKESYGQLDVDQYCTNYEDATEIEGGQKLWQPWVKNGAYSTDIEDTRQQLGGRWLSANYKAGDVLIFGMFTMHASMDNQTKQLRLSTDTRYQLATEPIDDRWVGEHPNGHGPQSKIGMIC